MKKASGRHARPLSSKDPIHLVLKSSQARGARSFGHSKNVRPIRAELERHCNKYGVKLMSYSNNFSHLHMLLKFPSRSVYMRFIRSLTSGIAMIVTGARKLARLAAKFWDRRPFTRVVRGYKAYKTAAAYVRLNQLEAEGKIPHRESRLKGVAPDEWAYF